MITKSQMPNIMMKGIKSLPLLVLLLAGVTRAQEPLPGNIGDRLDRNDIPASKELREEEFINKPDHIDENSIPSHSEAREREEEIEPADLEIEQNKIRRTP